MARLAPLVGLGAAAIVVTAAAWAYATPESCCHSDPPKDCCHDRGEHEHGNCPCCDHVAPEDVEATCQPAPTIRALDLSSEERPQMDRRRARDRGNPTIQPRARSSPVYLLTASLRN